MAGAQYWLKRGDVLRLVGPDGTTTLLKVLDYRPGGVNIALVAPPSVKFHRGLPPADGQSPVRAPEPG